MKTYTKTGIFLIGVILLVLCGFVGIVSAAQTWYVDDDGGANFTKIQDAVNNAIEGDTIIVRDGTYTENINVTDRLTIRSENGSENCIVQASNPADPVFWVFADYVNLSGFTVKGASGDDSAGIFLYLVDHCSISDTNTSDSYFGIHLYNSNNNILMNNTANSNEKFGIFLDVSSNNNKVTNNTANNNTHFGYSAGICTDYAYNNTIANNMVTRNNLGIYIWHSSATIKFNTAKLNWWVGIFLGNSADSNEISNNFIANNADTGIWGEYSNNNTLRNNTVFNNTNWGIYLISSSNNNVIYNNYFNNTKNARDSGNNSWNITKTPGMNIIGGSYLGGNYWSNYAGIDSDDDGLGDTPYDIFGGTNKDYLPLINISGTLGTISGKVTYTCNTTGIAGATVNLTQGGSVINSTITDSNGSYTFTDVPFGVYSVNASKLRFWDNATEVTVTAGAPIEADMMLWLKGDVYNDGVLDIYDIIMLRQAAAENIPWDYRYDLYVDDNVDIYDIIVLRQAVAGNIVLE
jgi:parallel beta-helix repeat protein